MLAVLSDPLASAHFCFHISSAHLHYSQTTEVISLFFKCVSISKGFLCCDFLYMNQWQSEFQCVGQWRECTGVFNVPQTVSAVSFLSAINKKFPL